MDGQTVQPFDEQEFYTMEELCIRSIFTKQKNQPVIMKSQVLIPPGKQMHISLILYILIHGLSITLENIKAPKHDLETIAQRDKLQPLVDQIVHIINFMNPEQSVKDLLSKLNQNDGNPNPAPSMPPK